MDDNVVIANVKDKIKRLDQIIDYDRPLDWVKEIYCVEVLKQMLPPEMREKECKCNKGDDSCECKKDV